MVYTAIFNFSRALT